MVQAAYTKPPPFLNNHTCRCRYNVGHLYILSKDLVAVIQNCRRHCPDPNSYEDVVIGHYVNRFAKRRVQWGSWGLRHVVYGADGTMLGDSQRRGGPPLRELFTPWLILAHGVKAKHWLDATRYFRDVLTVETILASAQENFVDGETTLYWDVDCVRHKPLRTDGIWSGLPKLTTM